MNQSTILPLVATALVGADAAFARDGAISLVSNGILFDPDNAPPYPGMEVRIIHRPDQSYKFLHDTAIFAFKKRLYAAWYNCPVQEMKDTSVIRGCHSDDGGKTWSPVEMMAQDIRPGYQYVPPAFAEANGKLFLLVQNHRGETNDDSFQVFQLDELTGKWNHVRTIKNDFLPNTNGIHMANGKLIVAGRNVISRKPAVLIFDDGTPIGPYREIEMDPAEKVHPSYAIPEASVTVNGNEVLSFVRCEQMSAYWLYASVDGGETWKQYHHDVPVAKTKLYSGRLSDGRCYLIFNSKEHNRKNLYIAFTKQNDPKFSDFYLLRSGTDEKLGVTDQWSYPCACEFGDKLYITCTCKDTSPEFIDIPKSAAALITLPLK